MAFWIWLSDKGFIVLDGLVWLVEVHFGSLNEIRSVYKLDDGQSSRSTGWKTSTPHYLWHQYMLTVGT